MTRHGLSPSGWFALTFVLLGFVPGSMGLGLGALAATFAIFQLLWIVFAEN